MPNHFFRKVRRKGIANHLNGAIQGSMILFLWGNV